MLILAGILLLVAALVMIWPFSSRSRWDPSGRVRASSPPLSLLTKRSQHCYVTGGSSGLGLALAIILTKKGADVSIVARNEENLRKALELLEVFFLFFQRFRVEYSYVSFAGISDQP
jgi:3-dehydrosphinganine reductase